jgi:ribosome production factor 2
MHEVFGVQVLRETRISHHGFGKFYAPANMAKFGTEPKSAKGKRILASRGPVLFEDEKLCTFLRGKNCSGEVSKLLVDLMTLKKPLAVSRKKDANLYPFQDSSVIERLANLSNTNLVVLGESSKKRKAALVMMRMFNEQLLDAIEINVTNYQPSSSFKGIEGCALGAKPLMIFQGAGFSMNDTPLSRAKNMFLDLFKGADPKGLSLQGVEHCIVITETEGGKLLFRVYRLDKKRGESASVPRVEMVEMGPSFDFTLGRERLPDFTLWKASMKKPTKLSTTSAASTDETGGAKPKKKSNKNISTDGLGRTIGRIHMGRQDYTKLNTVHRKSKFASSNGGPSQKRSRH